MGKGYYKKVARTCFEGKAYKHGKWIEQVCSQERANKAFRKVVIKQCINFILALIPMTLISNCGEHQPNTLTHFSDLAIFSYPNGFLHIVRFFSGFQSAPQNSLSLSTQGN